MAARFRQQTKGLQASEVSTEISLSPTRNSARHLNRVRLDAGAAPATTRALSTTEQQLVDSISIASIKETVNALAADEMQGRGTAQPGGDKAAA